MPQQATFALSERREIEKIAKSKPAEHGLPFSTGSLANCALCTRYSFHLTTKCCRRVADLATAGDAEIACTPANSSWMNT